MVKTPMTPAERSKRSRDKKRLADESKAAMGIKTISFEVSASEFQTMERLAVLRAGCREPYEVNDYAATLLRTVLPIDEEQYHQQANALGTCNFCNEVLPKGCGGAFKMTTDDCYHTAEYKKLELSRVTLSK